MLRVILLNFLLVVFFVGKIFADEGMWIPLLLDGYNISEMQKKGFKLTAEDIYSINKASMKDAVMLFGGGCTAELISDNGLIITNHHCGYGSIQEHSSLNNDYLSHGFWAKTRDEELVNPNLTVTFLVEMRDVTDKVLDGYKETMTEREREMLVALNSEITIRHAKIDSEYGAVIKPFFAGNAYYLFVTQTFKDVRLVGAPPSAIGKFGGDTDNWMWPRHTGDFSLFRIYANKDNKPAAYSPDNVPYKPKKFFPVSVKGVNKGDFTMVFGYPGYTTEYMPSYYTQMITQEINPVQIDIRQQKIDIIAAAMKTDAKVRIQYSAKYAGISNAWKKWIGQNRGLKRKDAIAIKKTEEHNFQKWIADSSPKYDHYADILTDYDTLFNKIMPYQKAFTYLSEAGISLDIIKMAAVFNPLLDLKKNASPDEINRARLRVKKSYRAIWKDFDLKTDIALTEAMLAVLNSGLDTKYRPVLLSDINRKFKGDVSKFTRKLYSKSMLTDSVSFVKFVDNFTPSKASVIEQDPFFEFRFQIDTIVNNSIRSHYVDLNYLWEKLDRHYMKAQMEFKNGKMFYPDANMTLRVAYGAVDTYSPADGILYNYFTTLDGIIEKDNPEIYDYTVPEKLKELYRAKDYGDYGVDGRMPVCFIATNHTSGGNSGSPVINADGHLIGINFDRNWEGTMSDIMYDPNQCRNISLDIRFVLFIIDKFADASYLIDEMEVVRN